MSYNNDSWQIKEWEWVRITHPQKKQNKLFKESVKVYESLFLEIDREPAANLLSYILDCEENKKECRKRKETPESEYYYYAAVFKSTVCGMASFDIYRKPHLGAVAYICIHNSEESKNPNAPPEATVANMLKGFLDLIYGISRDTHCTGMLFEIDPVEQISKTREFKPRHQPNWIRFLQKRAGARKIGRIKYCQPKLEWEHVQQEHAMHLLLAFLPDDPRNTNDAIHWDREKVKHLLKFIYLTWYYEGFEVTEKGPGQRKRLKEWKSYLKGLYDQSTIDLPDNVPLYLINTDILEKKIFISYPEEYKAIAEYANDSLKDNGLDVFYWDESRTPYAVRFDHMSPYEIIDREIEKREILIFLLTDKTLSSGGQTHELEKVRELRNLGKKKIIIPLSVGGVKLQDFSKFRDCLCSEDKKIVTYGNIDPNPLKYKSDVDIVVENLLARTSLEA